MPILNPTEIVNHPLFGDRLWSRLCFAVTLLTVLSVIATVAYDQYFISKSSRAQGRVIKVKGSGTDDQTAPVVEFTASNGKIYNIEGKVPSYPANFKTGDTTGIFYDRANPQSARIDSWLERFFITFVSLVLAITFGLFGRYFAKRAASKSNSR